MKLEGQVRRLELELVNLNEENEKMEFTVEMHQEQVEELRALVVALEQQKAEGQSERQS